jgi:hypothetical protein
LHLGLQPASESYCFAKEEMLDGKEKFQIFENLKPTQMWSLLEILFFPEQWEMET